MSGALLTTIRLGVSAGRRNLVADLALERAEPLEAVLDALEGSSAPSAEAQRSGPVKT